jgi:hypothetical protein
MRNNTTLSEIRCWLADNVLTIDGLIAPLMEQRQEALSTYDSVFHQEIMFQFEELSFSIIGIEVCKNLGCSISDYYEAIDGLSMENIINDITTWRVTND